MSAYRHIVTLPYDSGLPEDVAVNTFHSDAASDAQALGFVPHLITFYQAIDVNLAVLLSSAANAAVVRTYDLADPTPRVPIGETTFTLTTGASSMPPEVALCMSFQGSPESGIPQARKRGRIFLGPLALITNTVSGRPDISAINVVRTAADNLRDNAIADPLSSVWAVYSPTNNAVYAVADGWVDDEFDTIRRRGLKATSRNTF